MTALDRYVRLEATGLWREGPDAAPREVIVSFGAATLILRDLHETPLGHWALAGLRARGRDGDAVIYATTADAAETLTIRDREMNAAIASVAGGDAAWGVEPPARRPRAVTLLGLALLAGLAVAATRFGPDLIRGQAARMMPPAQAVEFGDRMLLGLMEARGGLCDSAEGQSALARLGAAVAGAGPPPRVRAVPLGSAQVAALPGATVLVNRTTLLDASAPEELAGWIAVGAGRDPVAALLRDAGLVAASRYLATGDLGPRALERAADAAAARPPTADEAAAALARLAAAGIDPAPFADALRRAGLIAPGAAVPVGGAGAPLGAQEWAAIGRLCEE